MFTSIPGGVWPTMLTPFTGAGEVDYPALERLIEWYIRQGVDGLFAVCQSSEMFFLSLAERIKIAGFVVEKAAGRVPVIASGDISDAINDQIKEIRAISACGIDAFVLISNRLAAAEEPDEVWRHNAELILREVPGVPFGIYECPYPYKRLLSPELLKWCASTGRFIFLKDTCCNIGQINAKLEAVRGTPLKIFNANSSTLLESLKLGAAGFSGVMANFHPDLYVWLVNNWQKHPEAAEEVQDVLGSASVIELQRYPVNAKYHLNLCGVEMPIYTRTQNAADFAPSQRLEVEELHRAIDKFRLSMKLADVGENEKCL